MMSPARAAFSRRLMTAVCLSLALLGMARTAHALRVMSYNVLNYPGGSGNSREDDHRVVILDSLPDLIVVQEITTTSGATEYLNDVLNTAQPGQWAMAPFTNGPDTDNACYYKTALLDYVSNVTLTTTLRQIDGWTFRPDGFTSAGAEFTIFSLHLKASQGTTNEDRREEEAEVLRNYLNATSAGQHFIVGGDFNIYDSGEPAWAMLTGSQIDNDGRLFDPIDTVGNWHNNSFYASVHTQSTRSGNIGDGGASGGMDDRFDMILVNDDMEDGEGIDYVVGTYDAFGQDGNHFNQSINTGVNTEVSAAVADALHFASDHLPVIMEVQIPAQIQVAGSLSFGSMLVGSAVQSDLTIDNDSAAPADDLDYQTVGSAGFTAPVGSFSLGAGGSENRTITVDTSSAGNLVGTVTVVADDPDTPVTVVNATADVLDPSDPSLDGGSVTLAGSLDWGVQELGNFTPLNLDVHNFGHSSLQALLDVFDAQVSGPDASRFSVPGFSPTLVGGTEATFSVDFDDTGASEGSTYTATLTFKTRDDNSVLGWANRSDLVVSLSAEVDIDTALPNVPNQTALYSNVPNPFNPQTVIRFDLAEPGPTKLSIYNVQGRIVRTLVDGFLPADRHQIQWDGRGDGGVDLSSGVYFYRLVAGELEFTRRMTLIR